MGPRLSVSHSAVELIKAFEGFRANAVRLDDGRWMIGYGHTATAREGARVSRQDAEALLLYDLIHVSHAVSEHVHAPLNQNQFDALVAFVFNIGEQNFRGSITLRRLNEGRPLEAALAMALWRRSDVEGERIIVDSLVRRRVAEVALFLRPPEGWTPAPTPVLPPRMDYDALGFMPLQTPATARVGFGEAATAERHFESQLPPPPEEPLATETAAQAVIERLESILAEGPPTRTVSLPPSGEALAASPTPELAPEAEPAAAAEVVAPIGRTTRPKRSSASMAVQLALAAAGLVLVALAATWGFSHHGGLVLGVSQPSAGLAVGVLGVACFSVGSYFLLARLGDPA